MKYFIILLCAINVYSYTYTMGYEAAKTTIELYQIANRLLELKKSVDESLCIIPTPLLQQRKLLAEEYNELMRSPFNSEPKALCKQTHLDPHVFLQKARTLIDHAHQHILEFESLERKASALAAQYKRNSKD